MWLGYFVFFTFNFMACFFPYFLGFMCKTFTSKKCRIFKNICSEDFTLIHNFSNQLSLGNHFH